MELNDLLIEFTNKGRYEVFKSKDGKIDYSQCLVDNSEAFCIWIRELFKD